MHLPKKGVFCTNNILLLSKNVRLCSLLTKYYRNQVFKTSCETQASELSKIVQHSSSEVLLIDAAILDDTSEQLLSQIKSLCPLTSTTVLYSAKHQNKLQSWLKHSDHLIPIPRTDLNLLNHSIQKAQTNRRLRIEIQHQSEQLRLKNEELQVVRAQHLTLNSEIKNKENFIHQLSTQLQLPLKQITQFAHIGLKRIKRKENQLAGDYLSEVKWISEELMFYVRDLEELTQLKSGKNDFALEEIDVFDFLNRYKREFQPVAENHCINYEVSSELTNACVLADYNELSKVVTIILHNAFRYTPERGCVAIYAYQKRRNIHIAIQDSGPGIPKKKQRTLFNMYEEINLKKAKDLKGFGLSICKELMRSQNGNITLDHQPNSKGTRFILTLPRAQSILD